MNATWTRHLPEFIRARLEARPNVQKIVENMGWLSGDTLLRMAVGLVVGLWLARYLGPELFGLYSYVLAFAALFGPLASLGMDSLVVRDLVESPGSRDEILGTAYFLKLGAGAVALVLALGTILLLRPGDSQALMLVAVISAGMLFQGFDVVDLWFRSRVESRPTVVARNATFLGVSGAKVALLLGSAPLIAFVWASLAEIVVGAAAVLIVFRRHGHRVSVWRFDSGRVRELTSRSWPLLLSGIAVTGYMRLDMIMLGELAGDAAVGIYSAAARVSEAWYFIPMSLVASIFPSIVSARQASRDVYLHRLAQLYGVLAWTSIGAAALVSVLAGPIVTLLYGAAYGPSAEVLRIHVWAGIAVFLGVGSSQYLVAENLTRISLYRTSIGLAANVALNLLWIPEYGASGAALATVVSYFLSVLSLAIFPSTRAQAGMLVGSLNPGRLFNRHV